nr:MAG TPA: hypothetical protein [Caudoviricetes sp.]
MKFWTGIERATVIIFPNLSSSLFVCWVMM